MAKDGWMDDSFIVRLRDEQMGIFREPSNLGVYHPCRTGARNWSIVKLWTFQTDRKYWETQHIVYWELQFVLVTPRLQGYLASCHKTETADRRVCIHTITHTFFKLESIASGFFAASLCMMRHGMCFFVTTCLFCLVLKQGFELENPSPLLVKNQQRPQVSQLEKALTLTTESGVPNGWHDIFLETMHFWYAQKWEVTPIKNGQFVLWQNETCFFLVSTMRFCNPLGLGGTTFGFRFLEWISQWRDTGPISVAIWWHLHFGIPDPYCIHIMIYHVYIEYIYIILSYLASWQGSACYCSSAQFNLEKVLAVITKPWCARPLRSLPPPWHVCEHSGKGHYCHRLMRKTDGGIWIWS